MMPCVGPLNVSPVRATGHVGGGGSMVTWCASLAEPPQFSTVTFTVLVPVEAQSNWTLCVVSLVTTVTGL